MSESAKRESHGSVLPLSIFGVLLITYFGCPFVFFLPLIMIFPNNPPAVVATVGEAAFYPIERLANAFPAYGQFLSHQGELLEKILK